MSAFIALILLLYLYLPAVSSASRPSVNFLASHSRYIFELKDANTVQYTIFIFSFDEMRLLRGGSSWFNAVDQVFEGKYFIALARWGSKEALVQEVGLFGFGDEDRSRGRFNVTDSGCRNTAYVVSALQSGQPDILVVAQQVTGSGDANIRAFFIDDGMLQLIYWQKDKENERNRIKSASTSGEKAIENAGFMVFNTFDWERSEKFRGEIENRWKFATGKRAMVLEARNSQN